MHDEATISNTEKSRTTPAVALNLTWDLQGSYHFMSLDTRKILSRRNWTELPTPQEVIDQAHDLADKEELMKKDDTIPDSFQFSWDLLNQNTIDAPESRVITDEIGFAHKEADEASDTSTEDSTAKIEQDNNSNNIFPAERLENPEAQEALSTINMHQGAQGVLTPN